jgi:molecular chaperone GrpE
VSDEEAREAPAAQEPDGEDEVLSDAPAPSDPLEEARAEAGRLKDQLLRTAADFDNFRKRTRREIADAGRSSRDELLRELLPVFDNLERAGAHAESATDVQSLTDGIKMVLRQFGDTLGRLGIERVATVGSAFDPSVHEAIQHLESADFPPGVVAAEVQGGYRAGERLVRPALVVVAKAPAGEAEPPADADPPPDSSSPEH